MRASRISACCAPWSISVSYDLHGNVGGRVIDAIDMVSAHRTAPCIDVAETQRRALAMLNRRLAGEIDPFVIRARVPVLLAGERTSSIR